MRRSIGLKLFHRWVVSKHQSNFEMPCVGTILFGQKELPNQARMTILTIKTRCDDINICRDNIMYQLPEFALIARKHAFIASI